jgi:hypothetical protein
LKDLQKFVMLSEAKHLLFADSGTAGVGAAKRQGC